MSNFTIVFGYRNREVARVKRCLDSLANQELIVPVIFVDYGSDSDIATEISNLVSRYDFIKHVYNDTRGMPWNRSHALNTGIKLVGTPFTVTSDIDLVYNRHFTSSLIEELDEHRELHANAYALPKEFKRWDTLFTNPPRLKERNMTALGLVQGIATKHHQAIRGFDEYYRIWGVEDHDLSKRVQQRGVDIKWVPLKENPVYHQWHPSSGIRTRTRIPLGWQKHMANYQDDQLERGIERNPNGWGEILSEKERPALRAYQSDIKVDKQVSLSKLPTAVLSHAISDQVESLQAGETVCITFEDAMESHKSSKLIRLINSFNSISNKNNWPILLENDLSFFGNYTSIWDFRDAVMYWILFRGSSILDYYIDGPKDGKMAVFLAKR